ncbi:MAG: ABC transporter C-terminal domain-containing protein, partial [Tepidisphaeraceae bacterium]
RLLILRPPDVVDFDGTYSAWTARLARDTAAAPTTPRRRKPVRPQPGRRDNPQSRPFGKLSVEQLETQIHETETEMGDCQKRFTEADSFRDAAGGRELHARYDELAKRLAELEAEYFLRET